MITVVPSGLLIYEQLGPAASGWNGLCHPTGNRDDLFIQKPWGKAQVSVGCFAPSDDRERNRSIDGTFEVQMCHITNTWPVPCIAQSKLMKDKLLQIQIVVHTDLFVRKEGEELVLTEGKRVWNRRQPICPLFWNSKAQNLGWYTSPLLCWFQWSYNDWDQLKIWALDCCLVFVLVECIFPDLASPAFHLHIFLLHCQVDFEVL